MKLLSILLVASAAAMVAGDAIGQASEQLCEDVQARPLVEPGLAGPLAQSRLPTCDSRGLYYGFGAKPDYAAALQCGWYQRTHPDIHSGSMFDGVGVLTMLYANGRGVARDLNLALRFACELPWAAPAEMDGRILHLQAMMNGQNRDVFDLCDDATSGLSAGACASVVEDATEAERVSKRTALTARLTPAQKNLYDKLLAAETKFEDTRPGNELDMSGTARAMFAISDRGKLRDQFIINLQRFSRSDVPQATGDDVAKLDAQMNALYQRIMKAPDAVFALGTVKPDGIRETQRIWPPLRDAWIAFARAAYPKLASDRVVAQLIRLRLHQLQALPIQLE